MIVAGGRGTRLRPLTWTRPKPLVPFCGEPFLIGVVRRLAGAGITRVHLVVGADTEPFEVLRPSATDLGVEMVMVPEPEPLDTAGGVRSAVDGVDGAFLVLNGDVLTDVDLGAVLRRHREAGADATLVLTEVEDTSSYGVCVREGTRIVDFVEKPAPGTLSGQRAVNAGTYVLEPDVLLAHPPGRLSFERAVFPDLLARGGHVEGVVWPGAWADLGTPARFRAGTRMALDGELSWPSVTALPETASGVRVHALARVHPDAVVVPPVVVRERAVVEAGATIGPHAVLGAGAAVDEGAVVVDSTLLGDVWVGAGVAVRGCLLGQEVRVESGAELGTDVVIGDNETILAGEHLDDGARVPSVD